MRGLRLAFLIVLAVLVFVFGWTAGRWRPPAVALPILTCYEATHKDRPGVGPWFVTQFGKQIGFLEKPAMICNPTTKKAPHKPNPIRNGDHLHCYDLDSPAASPPVNVTDQFGVHPGVTVGKAKYLCEPTDKEEDKTGVEIPPRPAG